MPKIPEVIVEVSSERVTLAERLAISLFDLDYISPMLRTKLLSGRLDLRRENVIRANGESIMETGIPFTCELLLAATACDMIRSENRREGDRIVRVYLNRGNGWVKVSSNTILTIPIDGELHLNPEVFPSARESLPDMAPTPKRVEF